MTPPQVLTYPAHMFAPTDDNCTSGTYRLRPYCPVHDCTLENYRYKQPNTLELAPDHDTPTNYHGGQQGTTYAIDWSSWGCPIATADRDYYGNPKCDEQTYQLQIIIPANDHH